MEIRQVGPGEGRETMWDKLVFEGQLVSIASRPSSLSTGGAGASPLYLGDTSTCSSISKYIDNPESVGEVRRSICILFSSEAIVVAAIVAIEKEAH